LTSLVGRGDLAVGSGTYAASMPASKDASGKTVPAISEEGKFMAVYMKQADGSWKTVKDIWSSNKPVPAPAK
jgi:ketosteroid isomerase-like protein